ncbi:Alkaline nuclease [Dissostichus eleginoides]|uniref:Alkaline nuclease n=1 Tax=Dissostichus eleginoides TaxID=100907 RepID=A0AAD9CBY5_DISEL|nr:Alkaline nuclease [Dissostichus eleginoides]
MHDQNRNQISAADRTLKIPEVRYHPSIQPTTPRTRTTATTRTTTRTRTRTSQDQRSRPAAATPLIAVKPAVRPGPSSPQTGPRTPQTRLSSLQTGPRTPQVNPAVRPGPDAGKQSAESPVRGDAPSPEQVPLGLGVRVDQHLVEEVEVLTRGQSTNPAWFAWRKNRITASIAHSIAHCGFVNGKSQTPPTSYLAAVTGEVRSVRTRAMSWGVQMEAEAVRSYQAVKTAALGRSVSVLACGLFLDAQSPWLGASPDGIVTDSRTGQWLLCLEVKCPYKHKDRRVEDACRDDPNFCLKIQDENGRRPGEVPVYVLKSSHSYFTQVQFQMAVTGLHQADFVVFTLKETAVVPVTFDPELWEETLSKLETFYQDAVLPRLRDGGGASWSPEL